MEFKKEFTRIIQEAAVLSKAKPQTISSEIVVNGAGAVIETSKGEKGFDLRLIPEKGVLPPQHPVRLAARLNPKAPPKKIHFLEALKEATGLSYTKFAKVDCPDNKLYSRPDVLYPTDGFKENTLIILPLENGEGLVLAKDKKDLEAYSTIEQGGFYPAYLEFAHFILVNNGYGRISDIEKIIKSKKKPEWSVGGCYIFLPKKLSKKSFHDEGLLVTDANFSKDGVLINIPVSVFDLQIDDILTRLKKISNNISI